MSGSVMCYVSQLGTVSMSSPHLLFPPHHVEEGHNGDKVLIIYTQDMALEQCLQIIPKKDKIENILDFVGHLASVITTQFCHCSSKSSIGKV